MPDSASHISDQDLVAMLDGEISLHKSAALETHLLVCATCNARCAAIARTLRNLPRVDTPLPPHSAARALLKSRMAQTSSSLRAPAGRKMSLAYACVGIVLIGAAFLVLRFGIPQAESGGWSAAVQRVVPDPALTPGDTRSVTLKEVCSAGNADRARLVPASVAGQVFHAYGISNPKPRAFEVDYLINPALGGSDDIRNVWPQPYSTTMWSARVKDALEDYLHQSVCAGKLDLATAQRDISRDWVAAYKKYFHTTQPRPEHIAFRKDPAWE